MANLSNIITPTNVLTATSTNTVTNKTVPIASNTFTGSLPAANGGTGLTSPGTSGNVLTSNGTTWTSATPAAGGSLVFLSSISASASSTIDLETGVSSTYDDYMIIGEGIIRSTTSNLLFRVKVGGTYLTTNIYGYASPNNPGSFSGTDGFFVCGANTANTIAQAFTINILDTQSSTNRARLFMSSIQAGSFSQSDFTYYNYGGWAFTSGAIQGFRLYPSSGTITSGTFRLYGIKKS
jgi:hypothetical protein